MKDGISSGFKCSGSAAVGNPSHEAAEFAKAKDFPAPGLFSRYLDGTSDGDGVFRRAVLVEYVRFIFNQEPTV